VVKFLGISSPYSHTHLVQDLVIEYAKIIIIVIFFLHWKRQFLVIFYGKLTSISKDFSIKRIREDDSLICNPTNSNLDNHNMGIKYHGSFCQ